MMGEFYLENGLIGLLGSVARHFGERYGLFCPMPGPVQIGAAKVLVVSGVITRGVVK